MGHVSHEIVFSYSGAPRGEAYEIWREEFCRRFCQLDAEPTAAESIECTVEVTRLGALSFGAAHGMSASFRRTRPLLSDGCDDLVLVTAVEGDVLTVQRGQNVELRPSQMCLLSLDSVAESGLGQNGRFTALRIPRRDLMRVAPRVEDSLSKPLGKHLPIGGLVGSYFALCTQTGPTVSGIVQQSMAQHMTELVGLLAESTDCESLPTSIAPMRLEIIQAQILERLADPHLTIGSIARLAGMTPKQVQRLFRSGGLLFSDFVLEQRLLLARRLLAARRPRHMKIGDIAQDAGFGDLSYFNRSFRKRFAMTPSEWRDGAASITKNVL